MTFDANKAALAYMAEMMDIDEHEVVADQGANQTFRHMAQFGQRAFAAGQASQREVQSRECDRCKTRVTQSWRLCRTCMMPPIEPNPPSPQVVDVLTFEAFGKANRERCEAPRDAGGFGRVLPSMTVAAMALAAAGEMGEVCDGVYNIEHNPDKGITVADVLDEIGDVVAYLDLLAQRLGSTLEQAIVSKWDRVSAKRGYPIRIVAGQAATQGVSVPSATGGTETLDPPPLRGDHTSAIGASDDGAAMPGQGENPGAILDDEDLADAMLRAFSGGKRTRAARMHAVLSVVRASAQSRHDEAKKAGEVCERCGGTGEVGRPLPGNPYFAKYGCTDCAGTGRRATPGEKP